jgi:hypothetical protein
MQLSVVKAPAPRAELLTDSERDHLDRLRHRGSRRDEWIAGRLAARRVLTGRLGTAAQDISVLSDDGGAPRVTGGAFPLAISLSHDGGRVAVALAAGDRRVAVDVCDRVHARRLPPILRRLGVITDAPDDPCALWAALECALKLRRRAVTALLGAPLQITAARPDRIRVAGLGADAVCRVVSHADHAFAWAEEAA